MSALLLYSIDVIHAINILFNILAMLAFLLCVNYLATDQCLDFKYRPNRMAVVFFIVSVLGGIFTPSKEVVIKALGG